MGNIDLKKPEAAGGADQPNNEVNQPGEGNAANNVDAGNNVNNTNAVNANGVNNNYNPNPNQNYNQNQNFNQNYNPNPNPVVDNGGFGWGLLGCCIPIVGLILFLVWKDQKPRTAKAAGIGALVSVVLGIIYYILAAALGIGLAMM